jgi:hypothetical protein
MGVCNNIMNLGLNQQKYLPDKELSTSQGKPNTEVVIITPWNQSVVEWLAGWLIN